MNNTANGSGRRILVTNDDGINAPGLAVLERIAHSLSDDVWVVAPETEQSGASHSLTLSEPLRLRQVSERRFAVKGTPTDCVMMGVRRVIEGPWPDLVLSGVNRGQNLADDVSYSGTVAGASEGCALGIPSIALSQAFNIFGSGEMSFENAEANGGRVISALLKTGWPHGVLININFPDLPADHPVPVVIATQGRRDENANIIEERRDPRGGRYYWVGFRRSSKEAPEGTDLRAVYDGKIAVTPLHLDRTHRPSMGALRATLEDTASVET